MPRRRLVWTAAVLVYVMGCAIAGTVVALPLGWPIGEAAVHAQQVVDGKDPGVTLPGVVSEVKPQYTPEAMKAKIQGSVFVPGRKDGKSVPVLITVEMRFRLK